MSETHCQIFTVSTSSVFYHCTMDIGNTSVNAGNDGLCGRDVTVNVGNDDIRDYCELGLEAVN